MNNIALSIVLFVVYLSVVSCAIYKPKTSAITPQEKYKPIEQEIEQMLDEIYEVTPTEKEIAPFEILEVEDASMPTQKDKKKKVSSSLKTSKAIDIAKLNLRHARVACSILGIKQKVNDHDCNIAWMQAQINQQVKEYPEKVSEVYRAIALKFPDVVIPVSNQIQVRTA
ncbi:MAG: hypothetical protein HC820_01000 [Hydrococcus sp. RM1_1_31]|nr:hypothetical protein [Hydrococcus sp. RM1_1_31]